MSGTGTGDLRGRQRARRREAILAAAGALFTENGYQATSIEAIAERAEVGVATVYNYFGSKGTLLAQLLEPEFDALYTEGELLLTKPPADPVLGVQRLIHIYRHFQNDWTNRKLLSAILGPGLTPESVLDQVGARSESEVKRQLATLLGHYLGHGALRGSIDLDDAAYVVFCVFNQHFIEFITQPDQGFADMSAAMDRQIALFINALRAAPTPRTRRTRS